MKYTTHKILMLAAVGMFSFSGCSKLNDLKPGNALDETDAVSEENAKLLTNGIYDRFQDVDYYGRNYNVVSDAGGDMMKITPQNSNRFTREFQYLFSPTESAQGLTWSFAYKAISQANTVINKMTPSAGTTPYIGEAYFFRALAHFDLARRFARTYTNSPNPNEPNSGIPVVTTPVDPLSFKPSRNTLEETYNTIIADLKKAQEMAPAGKPVFRASRDVATALLTRVYLYKGDYKNVIAEASKIIGNYELWEPAKVKAAYEADNATSEDIFSIRFLTNESLGSNNFGYIYMASSKGGYGDIRLNNKFMGLLEEKDVRKEMIYSEAGANYLMKWSGNTSLGQPGLVNVKLLRLSEVLLNRAEAYAELEDYTNALKDVNALRVKRGLAAFQNTAAAAVKKEIETQRAIELVGEGHRVFDIFRKNQTRVVNDADALSSPSVGPKDRLSIYPIPQGEIDANPNIKQNPGYSN